MNGIISFFRKLLRNIFNYLWSRFWYGFVSLLPFVATFGILYFTLEIVNKWLSPFGYLQPGWLRNVPYSETVFALLFIVLIGATLKNVLANSLLTVMEAIVTRVPMIKTVYTGIKQLVIALGPQLDEPRGFTQAVIVEFPLKGIYSIGFVTTNASAVISPTKDKTYLNIFIPTTPNPTTGYFVMVPESSVIKTNLTRHEAMALIISGGIIQPKRNTDDHSNTMKE